MTSNMITPNMDTPTVSTAQVRDLLHAELAWRRRWPYVLLLLASMAMMIVLGTLLLTEEGLPLRTQLAFAGMVGIAACWTVFAGWVLSRRRVLYARQQILATRMAMTFSALFTAGALLVAWLGSNLLGGLGAGACGILMCIVAMLLHHRARDHRQALLLLRDSMVGS